MKKIFYIFCFCPCLIYCNQSAKKTTGSFSQTDSAVRFIKDTNLHLPNGNSIIRNYTDHTGLRQGYWILDNYADIHVDSSKKTKDVAESIHDNKKKNARTKCDYFGLKFIGWSDEKIIQNALDGNYYIILLDNKSAWEKYGKLGIDSGAWKDEKEFNNLYKKANDEYNNFKTSAIMDGERKFIPGINEYEPTGWGKHGIEIQHLRTKEQAAFNKGHFFDDIITKKFELQDFQIISIKEEGNYYYGKKNGWWIMWKKYLPNEIINDTVIVKDSVFYKDGIGVISK